MSTAPSTPPKLPVWETIGLATQAIMRHWQPLFRAIAIPAVLIAGVQVISFRYPEASLLLFPLSIAAGVLGMMMTVSCHRLMLLGVDSLPNEWGVYWTPRETRFLGWSFGISAIVGGLVVVAIFTTAIGATLAMVASGGVGAMGEAATTGAVSVLALLSAAPFLGAIPLVVFPAAIYVAARSTLVLPATAVDERPTLKGSWALSRSNGWRLALILILPSLFLGPLSWGASLIPFFRLQFMLLFVMGILGVVGIASLSQAYSWLKEHEQPGAEATI